MLVNISRSIAYTIAREYALLYLFLKDNRWDALVPSLIGFFAAWNYSGRSLTELPEYALYAVLYAVLYLASHCIPNQINGIEEDRINKPFRPIPAGVISVAGARKRSIVYIVLFLLLSMYLHTFWFAFGWIVLALLHNYGILSKHWYLKNIVFLAPGTTLLVLPMWSIVDPIPLNVWNYYILMGIWAGFAIPLQDLRDQAGDKMENRKTLPLLYGDRKARIFLTLHFCTISPLIYGLMILSQVRSVEMFYSPSIIVILIAQLIWHYYIALRLWLYNTPRQDDITYHWLVLLFCVSIPLICFI